MAYDEAHAYAIILGDAFEDRKEVTDYINGVPEITYWYACMEQCVFCASKLSAREISEKLAAKFPKRHLLVTRVPADSQGWLPNQAWRVITHPHDPRLPKPPQQ